MRSLKARVTVATSEFSRSAMHAEMALMTECATFVRPPCWVKMMGVNTKPNCAHRACVSARLHLRSA